MEILTLFLSVTCLVTSYITVSGKLNMLQYQETRTRTDFQKIMLDRNGNVYIGATNLIYKFTPGLTLESRISTGPMRDGLTCAPGNSGCGDSITDNHAVILEGFPDGDYFLFCGTVKQGLCSVYSMADLNTHKILDGNNIVNLIGSRKSSVAFFGGGNFPGHRDSTLYTAVSYDGRPTDHSPPALSARVLREQSGGNYNISYVFESFGHRSAIDITPRRKDNYIVKYIYAFEHEWFSYFITVQKDLSTEHYITRIARVCQNDTMFYSYTEVEIACRKAQLHDTFYNIAQVWQEP